MVLQANPSPLESQPTQDPELEQAFLQLEGKAAVLDEEGTEPPAEGEAAPPTEELPEFALPEGWDAHPDVAERLKSVDTEAYNRAKSHLTRSHTATVAALEATHKEELARAQDRATASQVVQQFAETIGNLDLDDAQSVSEARKLLHATDSWARVFLGAQERDAQASLISQVTSDDRWTKDLTNEVADEFNATVSEMSLKLRSDVARAENREEVTKAYTSALGNYLAERDKHRDKIIIAQALEKEKTRLEQLARTAAGLSEGRAGSPPARPPSGSSGSATLVPATDKLDDLFAAEQRNLAALRKGK